MSDLHVGQGGGGAEDSELGGGVRAGQHQLHLVRVEAWLYGQPGGPLVPGRGCAPEAGRHQQVGHGHAQHTRLLLAYGLWLHRAWVQTWGPGRERGRDWLLRKVYSVVQGWRIFVGQPGSQHRPPGFPWQQANGFFPLDFGLLQKISFVANASLWYSYILLSKIIFTNEHDFYDFWSVNVIARSFLRHVKA